MITYQQIDASVRDACVSTTPATAWRASVVTETLRLLGSPDGLAEWMRETLQRERLTRYWSSGEPVWMSVAAMAAFWKAKQTSEQNHDDSHQHISSALKGRKE